MFGFEATNDNGDTVAFDRSRTFYYLGQLPNTASTTFNSVFWIKRYQITSTTVPMFFVELLANVKWAMYNVQVVGNVYTVGIMINANVVPRVFAFAQSPISQISDPNDYSLALYDENGSITFDGTRELLYTPAVVDYWPSDFVRAGNNLNTINVNTTRLLSYQGSLPSAMAIHCPSISFATFSVVDTANAQNVITTCYSGATLIGGSIYSCFTRFSAATTINAAQTRTANLTLHINSGVIDIARYI